VYAYVTYLPSAAAQLAAYFEKPIFTQSFRIHRRNILTDEGVRKAHPHIEAIAEYVDRRFSGSIFITDTLPIILHATLSLRAVGIFALTLLPTKTPPKLKACNSVTDLRLLF